MPSHNRGARGWGNATRALGHRNYRLFFGGQSISLIGTWMTRIATSWLVYRLTGSALLLGLVSFAGQIPTFLAAPFAGVWVDRWNRHRVLVATQILAMLQSFALAALALTHITIPEIILLACAQGLINAFDMPGRQSFLVEMVESREDLSNAIALNSSMVNAARLVGPAIAGLVIALWGEGYCFLIDGFSYVAVIASLLAMRDLPQRARAVRTAMTTALRQGWEYVSGFVPARTLLLLLALISLVGMPFSVLMPIVAGGVLGGGAHTYGFLMGASGCGALTAAAVLAARKSVRGLTRLVPASAAVFGVGLIGLGASHELWLSMGMIYLAGAGMMHQMAATNTILQTLVSEDKRGRLMSYYTMAFVGMAPWGSLLAGTIAAHIGAPRALLLMGCGCLAGAAWFTTKLSAVRDAIRPVYRELGILPEARAGVQAATQLTTPPEE